jgi:hypothetical protein
MTGPHPSTITTALAWLKARIMKRAAALKETQLAGRKQANVGRRLAGSQSKSDKSVSSLARSLDDPETRRATTPINTLLEVESLTSVSGSSTTTGLGIPH